MEEEPENPSAEQDLPDEETPPPFDPDPRIVTYLERGSRDDAEERFRKEVERIERGREMHPTIPDDA
jgi:hypothetical protein